MSDDKKRPIPERPLGRARAALDGTVPSAEDGEQAAASEKPAPAAEEARSDAARPADETSAPDPTRYGDWERKGRCIDF